MKMNTFIFDVKQLKMRKFTKSGNVPVHPWLQFTRQQFNLRKELFHQCHFESIELYFKIAIQNTLRQR